MSAPPEAMRAVTVTAPGTVSLDEVAVPEPASGEVLVRVLRAGICASDIEVLEGTRPAPFVRYPITPGHEWTGTVARVGADVLGVSTGALVVAEGFRACGNCARCREGLTNLCTSEYAETGFTNPGAFADYVAVPASLLHLLPAGTDARAAALVEPAACVACGLLETDLLPGMTAAVVGAGTLGLLAISLLRLVGPARLAVVDPHEDRLQRALALGASESATRADYLGGGFDLVVEAAGHPDAPPAALGLARRGGTVILEGLSGAGVPTIDPDSIAFGHLNVRGVFGASRRAWSWVVELLRGGAFEVASLVTHSYGLEEYEDAFSTLRRHGGGTLKVQFVVAGAA